MAMGAVPNSKFEAPSWQFAQIYYCSLREAVVYQRSAIWVSPTNAGAPPARRATRR